MTFVFYERKRSNPKKHGNSFECDSLDNINKFKTSITIFG
jgi:hypothetical protein